MQNELETYFARHTKTISIDDETRDRLWAEKRVAIHYPFDITGDTTLDSRSINPDDYLQPAKKNVKALCNLAQKGGYVCAQYYGHDECVLGFVEPQSNIEIIEGKWRSSPDKKGRVSDANQIPDTKDRIAVLKTIALTKVKIIEPERHAMILVGRPRQGALTRWLKAGKVIEELVEGRESPLRLTDLSPTRQEIMCSEFLRMPEAEKFGLPTLKHLLLPVGRTMKDIDIAALAKDGSLIYAQVTLLASESEKALHKLQRLSVYGNNHLILFCKCGEIRREEGVTVFPIDKVFEVFCASELGQKWLDAFVTTPMNSNKDEINSQLCPVCGAAQNPSPRYPHHLCGECAAQSTDESGRPLEFYNESISGGFQAVYADTGEQRESHICFVQGIRCWADEARFGGIVIQPQDATETN